MRFLKIFGISIAVIFGLLGVAVGIAALTGAFSQKPIHISAIYFEEQVAGGGEGSEGSEGSEVTTQKVQSVYDIIQIEKSYIVKYEPASANDLELTVTVEGDKTIFENIPSKIVAGKPFSLKPVVKDGVNVSGSVCLKISNPYCSVDCLLYVAVDMLAEEKLQVNASTFKDCFTFETDKDEEYLETQSSGITQTTGVATSTSNTTFNFVNSTPKTIWVNSIYTNVLDIDTGGVFPAGTNAQVSNLFREISFELVRGKAGQSSLDSLVPKSFVALSSEYVKNQYGYMLNIAPSTLNEYKQFDIKVQMHRSYEIQKAFKDGGFNAFREYAKEIYSDQYLNPTDNDWYNLQNKLSKNPDYIDLCENYYNFLNKYRNYFVTGNLEGNIVNDILENTKSKTDIKNIIKTLDAVFITQYQTIRILDVDVESFTIDYLNDWNFSVFDEKSISIEEIVGGGISDNALNFQLKATNTQSNLSAAEITAILENLKRSFTIEVYVKNTTDTNKNKTMGLIGAFEGDGIIRKIGDQQLITSDYNDYSADQNFLSVKKDIENKAWTFTANVPSIEESEKEKIEFEILLAFRIDTTSLKGEQISFYNFVPVNIYKTNVDGRLTVEANNVMYINDATIHTEFASNTQQISFSGINNLPGKNISVSNDLEYTTIKLFADVDSIKVLGEDLNKIELSEEVLATRFSFQNADKNAELYKNAKGENLEGYELGTIRVDENGNWNFVDIKAINACSSEPLKLFAVLLFTDKDGNAIDRNGNKIDVSGSEVTYVVCEVSDMDEIIIKATIDNFYFYTPITMEDSTKEGYSAAYLIPNNKTGKVDVYKNGDVLLRNNRNNIYSSEYTSLKMITGTAYEYLYVAFDELGKPKSGNDPEIKIDGENVTFNFEFNNKENELEKKSAQNNYNEKMVELLAKNPIENLFEVVINGVNLTAEQIAEYVSIEVSEVMHGEFLVGVKISLMPKKECVGQIKLSSKYNTPLSQNERLKFGVMSFAVNSVELTNINAYASGNFVDTFEEGVVPEFTFNGVYNFATEDTIKNKETIYFRENEAELGHTPAEIPNGVIPYCFREDLTYLYANIPDVGKLNARGQIVNSACFNVQQYLVETALLENLDGVKFNDLTDDQYLNYKNNIIDASVNSVSKISADVMSTFEGDNPQIRVVFYLKSNNSEEVYKIFNREFIVPMSSEWELKWLGYIDTLNDYYQIVLINNQLPFNSTFIAKEGQKLNIKAFFEYAPNLMFTEPASTIVKDMIFNVEFLPISVLPKEGVWTPVAGLKNTYSTAYVAGNNLAMMQLVQDSGVDEVVIDINKIIDRTENKFTNNNITISSPAEISEYYEVKIDNSTIGATGVNSEIEIILSYNDCNGLNEYTFKITVNPEITYSVKESVLNKQNEYYYDASNFLLNIMARNNSNFQVDLEEFITISNGGTGVLSYSLYKENDASFAEINIGKLLTKAGVIGSGLVNKVENYNLRAMFTKDGVEYVVYNIKVRIFPEYDIALKNVRYSNLYYSENYAFSGHDLTSYLDYKKYNFNSGVYDSIDRLPDGLDIELSFSFDNAISYLKDFTKSYYNYVNIYKMYYDSVGNTTDAFNNLNVSVDSNNILTFTNFEQVNLEDQADKEMGLLIPVEIGLPGFNIDSSILVVPAFLYNLEFNEDGSGFDSYEDTKQNWRNGDLDKEYDVANKEYNINNIVLDAGTYDLDRFFNYTYDKNLVTDQSKKYIVVAKYQNIDNSYYSIQNNSKLIIKEIPAGGLNITLNPTITVVDMLTNDSVISFNAQEININILPKISVNVNAGFGLVIKNNVCEITNLASADGIFDGEYSLSNILGAQTSVINISNDYITKYELDISKLSVSYSAVGEGIIYIGDGWEIIVEPNAVGYAVLKAEVKYDEVVINSIEFRFKVGKLLTTDSINLTHNEFDGEKYVVEWDEAYFVVGEEYDLTNYFEIADEFEDGYSLTFEENSNFMEIVDGELTISEEYDGESVYGKDLVLSLKIINNSNGEVASIIELTFNV